nr:MAG TPA: hypothetical protein [Caudoviricetes sp.]
MRVIDLRYKVRFFIHPSFLFFLFVDVINKKEWN